MTPNIDLTIVKTNDADRHGTYTDDELAPAPGASVPFRDVITKPVLGGGSHRLAARRPLSRGRSVPGVGQNLIGQVLAGQGWVRDREFTVDNDAPPFGSSLVNTATVVGSQAGQPGGTRSAEDHLAGANADAGDHRRRREDQRRRR